MPQTFDLVLSGGTVVNQDGIAERDIGVREGRITAIGDLSAARPASGSIAPACTCCPA